VSELKLHRDMSRNALFDVMIVLHPYNIKMEIQQMGEVKVTAYEEAVDVTSKFDLLFRFTEWGEEVQLNIEYNNDIYDKITADQLLDHFERLLTAAIAQPEAPIQQLDLLSTAEKDLLLLHFNNTNADYPRDKTIVSLFEEQATKTPDSIALVFENKQFTYGMLNDMSNRLGNYLRIHYRVQPDDLIGIKLARNEWMIMSILGILKSGGAYVPIDPEYPQERIGHIIADSRCKVVIDEPEFLKFKNEANKYDGGNLVHINNPADLAYVMYTSGSTGKPKGVMIEHRNVVSLLENFNAHLFQDNTLIMGAAASYTFDMSVLELIGSLVKGTKLFLIASADPLQILKHITDGDMNALQITPSRLTQLIESGSGNVKALGQLKVLLVGGETLGQSNYERLKELTGTKVKNVYGPTETTVWSSCLDVHISASLSIGKPLLNETIYITDEQLNISPRGVVGEICIGGEGLGRGYWRLPELTAEKFVDNPFKPGERLYKTGDLGRWLIDGNIEFIGRKDDQVKIRGYRVELGEIESALLNHPAVTAAVVIAKDMKDTSRELVAYIVSGEKLPIAELRTYLSRSLPVYMLPAHFVQLDQLPLSSRGKVDKRKLPYPNGMDIATGTAYVLPRNAIEEKLALIWQEVLGLDSIGVKDNFFNLGGHSLKATRLASRIHKAFEVKIAFIDLFKFVLLEDQARLIEQAQKTSFITIPAIGLQANYPLSSSQRRLWIVSQFEEANIAYNIPGVYVLEGALNTAALSGAFDRLIKRHETLRTVFNEDEQGNTRQFIISAEDTGFKIEYHDLREETELEQKARRIVQNEFTQPFDLTTGPLLRACLLHIDENKWVFTCTMHHIISDGWSKDILIKELLQFYNAHGKGGTTPLVPLRIHYKDYAVWQQEQLSSEALKSHKNYWLQQFTGELPVLELPEDKVRPLVKTYKGGVVKKRISPSVNRGLNDLVREQECTLFMGLLAAVNTLLFRYTNQEDIIIGTPIAGRMHSDLEDQIGFYVNTLAIRTRFTGTDDYRGVLKTIRQLTLDAYEHQVYPFDELVTELGLQRDMSRSALFDVMVTLQNAQINHRHEQPVLDDIRISAYELAENTASRFDLEFGFVEVGEELQISLVYNSDIYNKSTAEQFITHLNQLIEVIIACPGKPVNELEFLSEEEKHRQLIEFNNTDRPV
jgi:amino acid adenylation domain-containing protein